MTKNMKDFLKKVSEDKSLAEKVSKLDGAELIALAKELGFELTEADFAQPEGEMSADELETLAGGGNPCSVMQGGTECACPAVGVGKGDDDDKTCVCVAGGGGEEKNGDTRCVCVGAGMGGYHWQ